MNIKNDLQDSIREVMGLNLAFEISAKSVSWCFVKKIAFLIAVLFALGATRSLWMGLAGYSSGACAVTCDMTSGSDQSPGCDREEEQGDNDCGALMACCHCCCYYEDLSFFSIKVPLPENIRPHFIEAIVPNSFVAQVFHPPEKTI
jgi:hypothetical protein